MTGSGRLDLSDRLYEQWLKVRIRADSCRAWFNYQISTVRRARTETGQQDLPVESEKVPDAAEFGVQVSRALRIPSLSGLCHIRLSLTQAIRVVELDQALVVISVIR